MKKAILLAGASGLTFIGGAISSPALAGPVPGVETFTRRPVEFPHPQHLDVWEIGDDDYLVTFRWKPDAPVQDPAVAGTFNGWNRAELPLSGPDADGVYSVTARLAGGQYAYKFVAAPDIWESDPLNPLREEGGNSLLRLGVVAFLHDATPKRGDGVIESRAVKHDPAAYLYYDRIGTDDAIIRVRALANDVETVWIAMDGPGQSGRNEMELAASDELFDYFEHHLHPSSAMMSYHFVLRDGDASFETPERKHPDLYPRVNPPRAPQPPEWARDAIWYQIMVDRFRDGDTANNPEFTGEPRTKGRTHPWRSDWYTEYPWERTDGWSFWKWSMYDRLYGGDFRGLIDKLTYLKELGVTAIYLNPVFVSHNSHKYNARTYVHADDGYGVAGSYAATKDREDLLDPTTWRFNASDRMLLELIREVHARDMRIIFDGVWNHVGDDHPAFLDVRENGKESRYADWFNVVSWDPFVYRGWAGFDGLPEFAKSPDGLASESAKAHIFAVTSRWMDPNGDGDPSDGIDGWRLDVPMDVPMGFWVKWCAYVRSINPEAYITGEVWDPAEEWLDGQTFDAVMNYQLPKAAFPWFANDRDKITASEFDRRLARLRIRYPRNHTYVLQNLFDSHDTDRWVSRIVNPDLPYDGANRRQDEDGAAYNDARPPEEAYRRLRLMALFQATYVGAPMIWYGTEVGMYGADDPMCRMPMWWEDMEPFDNPDYRVDKDLREEFRALFHLRQREPLLRRGDYRTAIADDARDVFGYWRHDPADTSRALLVVLNNSDSEQTVEFPTRARKIRLLHATPGTKQPSSDGRKLTVTLPPIGGSVLLIAAE